MSVENSDLGPSSDPDAKPMNGERMNGISNGHSGGDSKHHKSSSSSSSHRHKSSGKDKHRDREHKSSNHSSSKHSSSSSSHKDKDRHHHSSSSSSHKSSSRDKDRDRHRDKDKKEHSSIDSSQLMPPPSDTKSSGDKHREHKSSKDHKSSSHDKDRSHKSSSSSSSSKDKDKDKDRHRSSSSSKHRHSSSSSSSKHKDSKNRDRERSDKDRSSSSSHSHRHHDSSSSSKSKHSNGERSTSDTVDHIKKENEANGSMNGVVHHNNSVINNYSDEDVNPNMRSPRKTEFLNISQNSSCDYSLSQFRDDEPPFVIKQEQMDDSENVDGESQDCTYNNHNMNEEESEEDIPLSKRKIKIESDDEDDIPLTERKKMKTEKKAKKKKHASSDEESDYDDKPKKKKMKKEKKHKIKSEPVTPIIKAELNTSTSPVKGRKKKEEESAEVWKWWEEEKREDGVKWNFLEHKGPVFAPDYEPLPDNVQFLYDGKPMKLSQNAEEIACFYAKMLDHEYTSKKVFNDNFFHDWRKSMTTSEREKIHRLEKCNFKQMHQYFTAMAERNRNRTKEEKAAIKAENERLVQEYGFCTIDGHKEKIGNFKIEPPGLFRGRGEHPKMGKVKLRVMPEDILINCSKDSKPPVPPPGHRWKEVRNDNTVTWLASWVENVQSQVKYIMLNPSSKLKGEKDWQKYETARRLHKHIKKIRNTYREEWKSREMRIRQRGVALYFIDKLALRAGNEKDEDQADTVGCCSLRFEHIQLHKNLNGKECVVIFDFLGKDSIRYYNEVEVEKRVFKNLELFCENKKEGDEIFDRLNTTVMNEHLRELMDGLTAKVFRTYNASYTLQCQLDEMTDPKVSIPEKLLAYNRANRAVAILCNHQRAVPKTHAKSMENLKEKIRVKREAIEEAEGELHDLEKRAKRGSVKERLTADKKRKQLERLNEQLKKLELQETDRDENKTIALGTSKLNYLDPRISVAWCKKYGVPIEKIYNKTQRDKFRWAIDMATESYRF